MSTKHTPGPWVVTRDYSIVTDAMPAILLAKTASANYAANAKLIAAAPDMAEALRWIVDHGDTGEGGRPACHDMRAKARTALAKAGL